MNIYDRYNSQTNHKILKRCCTPETCNRATQSVPADLKVEMYKQYIKKAEQFFGVTKTREIYEKAVGELPDMQAKDMCLLWSEVERKLGEIDRARGLLAHASQFCDPRKHPGFWKRWHDFEVWSSHHFVAVQTSDKICSTGIAWQRRDIP